MTLLEPQRTLSLNLALELRLATADDLPKLEWFGQYKHFRNVFRRTFQQQQQGSRLMLVAALNDFPVGQLFIFFKGEKPRAYFYSFRVMDMFQRQGIGSWMLREAEAIAHSRGVLRATIAAAKDNLPARQLYERRGYRIYRDDPGYWQYIDHRGYLREVNEPCWVLEKKLKSR